MKKKYRIELELHSQLLRCELISTLDDFDDLVYAICPKHFQFVEVDWPRLRQHLRQKRHGRDLITGARQRAASLSRLRRYLRRHGIRNFHRFLVPLAINKKIDRAFTRWIRKFEHPSRFHQVDSKSLRRACESPQKKEER